MKGHSSLWGTCSVGTGEACKGERLDEGCYSFQSSCRRKCLLFFFFFFIHFFFFFTFLCLLLTVSFLPRAAGHFRCVHGKVLCQLATLVQSALYPMRHCSEPRVTEVERVLEKARTK